MAVIDVHSFGFTYPGTHRPAVRDIALSVESGEIFGFYWASAFLIVAISALLLSAPETARDSSALWVPAILVINLQITTLFFVAGLMLLERDEGTLNALAVSPLSASDYLAMRTFSLTALAAAETLAIVWIGFGTSGSWSLILLGTAALGVIYTGFGAAVATRYDSVNALLLPASAFVAVLLLPLLPHFGLAPRLPFFLHPLEPPMTLIRAGYGVVDRIDVAFGILGSFGWSALAFVWGRNRVRALMHNTRASGGR